MQNKKALYLLIPAVIIIWGIIAYKIIIGLNSDDNIMPADFSTKQTNKVRQETSNNYTLIASYRDPFLGIVQKTTSVINHDTIKRNIIKPIQKTEILFPNIVFFGCIKNKMSNKEFAIIKVDGKERTMGIGESEQGIEIKKIYKDSIVISFNNVLKTIKNEHTAKE